MIPELDAGFAALPVDDATKAAARDALAHWRTAARFAEYRPLLDALIARRRFALLLDCFYRRIPFGTGGRRGPVGVGPNRINPYTLSTSVQGHVAALRQRYGATAELAVVIAWDVRVFHDLRGELGETPSPLRGLSSRDLGWLAARVYLANDVRVHLLPPDDPSYLSTPELSFLIRELGAAGGLNVSASHNHPDDNGGKFYNSLGGQEIPPADEELATIVEQVDDARLISLAQALDSPLLCPLAPTVRRRYREHNLRRLPPAGPRQARIVFTPLHGTGSTTVLPLLQEAAIEVEAEPAGLPADGAFPTVPFRIPNPEVPQSLARASRFAQARGAQLVLATDPDADRLGAMAPDHEGGWRPLTGNEIGALLLHRLLPRAAAAGPPEEGRRPFLVTTWVTSRLHERLARAAGIGCVSTLLVGFKYIGEVLRQIEEHGEYVEVGWGRTLRARLDDFLLATEESHGYLLTAGLRDKDAAGAALLLAELAADLHARGETRPDLLLQIQRTHGVVENRLLSLVLQGATGLQTIAALLAALRQAPPAAVDGTPVAEVVDWQDEARFGPFLSGTDRGARNVLCFLLEAGSRITLRPSGTEPKCKIYVETAGPPHEPTTPLATVRAAQARLAARATQLGDAFVLLALRSIGREVPAAALRVSDLVPLELRVWVVTELLAQLLPHLVAAQGQETSRDQVQAWLDAQLRPCGSDARQLVAAGLRQAAAEAPGYAPAPRDLLAALLES